jgi:hypothetical protein
MPSPSRGRRALLLVAVLLAIPLLGAPGTWFWVQHTADRKWAEARLRIRELSTLHPAGLPPHPSSEISKELQIHFVAAIRVAALRSAQQKADAGALINREDGEGTDAVLADAQDFLDRVHEGARRCAATPEEFPPGWRGDWDNSTLHFILSCGMLRARRLRKTGAPGEAAEALLDALQLQRFWAASGNGVNRIDALIALAQPLNDLRNLLSNETLSRDELLRIGRELEPLDAALRPPSAFLEAAFARWAEILEAWDLEASGTLNDAPYRWRVLLPGHLMKAEAFEFYDRHIRNLIANEGRSYLELKSSVDQFFQQLRESENPILGLDAISPLEWSALIRSAELRLIRVAARYRATGEILPLKDPFGNQFQHRKAEHRTKFWSPGSDGRDDGGDAAKDLVIEVIG